MAGKTLGEYALISELGSGGMGKVYLAERGADRFALKIVHPHLLAEPGFFKRFLREAEIGKAVTHPNVVRCYDCDQLIVDGTTHAFLVMEYVEGQTLRELLEELETVPEELCRHIGLEVSKGLAAIHEAGVIHRDLKPENILITPDHEVKVMDLGVARLADEAMRLSLSGAFVGSPLYASPEHFMGGKVEVDGRADLFSLGVILYELACGAHPHRADDFAGVLAKVIEEQPRRLGERNPQLSAFFEEVVHALLAKEREGRFESGLKLLEVLEEGERSTWWGSRAKALRAETKRPLRRIRIPRETAVYGREDELSTLRSLYERAKEGEGQVVLIEGEAGIGKTRLVDELVGRLKQDGEDLNFLFGSYPPGGAATAAGAWSTAYREQFGAEGLEETLHDYLTITPILVPAFAALLRGEPPPDGQETLTKDSLQTVFVHATRALAKERTTVVLIEDLHFSPEECRALFSAIAQAVPENRILLVGTTRPGIPEDWRANLERLDQVSRMELQRLGPKDLAHLLREAFQSDHLAEELGFKIGEKSDGNPFFAFEIIRGLREGQFITRQEDGSWVSTQVIEKIEIPSSVLDLVNARVADLTEEERDLLDVACCWGFEFDPGLIGEVLGISRIPLLKRFGQLERKHRLVRASGRMMVFDHHQVQEALYGTLLEQLREEYHAALAEALESRTNAADQDPTTLDGALCVDLVDHYLKGARGQSALRYLEAAETHLTTGYLNAQAAALTERALAVPGLLTGLDRAMALVRLCMPNGPLDLLARRPRQEECAREAERLAEEAGSQECRGKAAMALGMCLLETSRLEQAEAACRRALDIAMSRGDRKAEASATGNLGIVLCSGGRLSEAREHYECQLAISREIGYRRGEAIATGNLGLDLWRQGRLAEAREHHERSIVIYREIGFRLGEAAAIGNLGSVFGSEGRLAASRAQHERSLAICREIGNRAGEAGATGDLGVVFWAEGRLAEAREHFERAFALSHENGDRRREAFALHNLGIVLSEQGARKPAREYLESCLSLSEEIGLQELSAATSIELGSRHAASADCEGARELLAAARDQAATGSMPGIETLTRCHLAGLPGGDPDDALAAFQENEERLDTGERMEARWLLFRATGDGAHLAEAKRLLDESVANVDEETRQSMLTNLRLNREIMDACREQGV